MDRSNSQEHEDRVDRRNRVDGRPASGTKAMQSLGATFGGLHVSLRLSACELERRERGGGVDAECGAGECLAVGAVAHRYLRRIHVGRELDVSAMTSACDVHGWASR